MHPTPNRHKKARPGGFEPPTYGLEVRCSVQLSYGRVVGGIVENCYSSLAGASSLTGSAVLLDSGLAAGSNLREAELMQ